MVIDDEKVVSYVECDGAIDSVDVQIAQYPCEQVIVALPEDILRQYVQEMQKNEMVSLATFGKDINFLVRRSQDAEEIVQIIDAIDFQDQDTHLTDYLFQTLEEIEKNPASFGTDHSSG